MQRTFIYTDDKSNKFWTIEIEGSSYTVTYGKVGTAGQIQTKNFADGAASQKAVDKLIAEKVKKGYIEQAANGAETQQPAEITTTPEGLRRNPQLLTQFGIRFEVKFDSIKIQVNKPLVVHYINAGISFDLPDLGFNELVSQSIRFIKYISVNEIDGKLYIGFVTNDSETQCLNIDSCEFYIARYRFYKPVKGSAKVKADMLCGAF